MTQSGDPDAAMKFGFEHDGLEADEDEQNVQTERTPLLATGTVAPTADPQVAEAVATTSTDTPAETSTTPSQPPADKPLPVKQLLLLCFARVIEPIAFFCVFPFINQMCVRNGNVPIADTGFYAGLIESLFSMTQMCVMILWGRLADRIGRKPVLVISLYGIAFTTALFGLAQSIWQMILFRCLAGVFAGSIVTIRTMITEHSTAKTQARAFSWFAFSGNMGILFGPLIGGALADPNEQFPGVFHQLPIFDRFPYALPMVVTGGLALVAATMTAMFAEETLVDHRKNSKKPNGDSESASADSEEVTTTLGLLKAPGVLAVLYLYSNIMLLGFAYTAVVPVFMFEPIELGGFGFTSFWISLFMALVGAAQAIWLLFIFPPLQHRIGTGGVLRSCAYAWPVFFVSQPLLNLLLRQHTDLGDKLFWILAPIALSIGTGVSMAFTAIQLAINDISPSPRVFGTLNALALTVTSGIRAIGPGAFASLFAAGVRNQILWGYLAWGVLIIGAFIMVISLRLLPEKAEGRVYEETQPDH